MDLPIKSLHKYLSHGDQHFILLNENGKIRWSSVSLPSLFSKTIPEDKSRFFINYIYKPDQKKMKNLMHRVIKKSDKEFFEHFRIRTDDDVILHYQCKLINFLDNDEISGILGFFQETTTQFQRENEIRDEHKKYEQILEKYQLIADNTIDVIFQVTLSGTYTFMNKASKYIAGYEPSEMIGKKWMSYVPKSELPRYLSKVKELIKGKKINDFQTFVIHKEGHLVPVEFSGSIIKQNNKTYISGVMRDLTRRIDSKQEFERIAKSLENQTRRKTNQLEESLARLKISEERYRMLFENANEGIIVVQDDYIKIANPKAYSMFGFKEDEVYKIPYDHFIHPDDIEIIRERNKQRLKGLHAPSRYEIRIIDKIKNIHWLELNAVQITWNDKDADLVFLTDITKRKNIQDKYKRLFENSPEALAEIDGQSYRIIAANSTMGSYIGLNQEKLIGKQFHEFLPRDLYKSRLIKAQEALDKNKKIEIIDSHKGRYYRHIINPIQYPSGKRNIQIIAQDITHIETTKLQLEEHERQLRAITASAKDAIILIDNYGVIVFWNPAAETIFGYSESEAVGQKAHDILSADHDSMSISKGMEAFQKSGKGAVIGKTIELNSKRKDGLKIIIELSISSLYLQNKWHALGIARDITQRKEMERELQQSKETLEQRVKDRTRELQRINTQLKNSEEQYRQLFQSAPIGIGIVDDQGRLVDINQAMRDMIGISKKVQKSYDFTKAPVDPKDIKDIQKQLLEKGFIEGKELVLRRLNEETYSALLDIKRVFDTKRGAHYLVIQRDISSLKEIQEEIIRTKNHLQNVINSSKEIIIAVDDTLTITMWNTLAEQVTGLSEAQVLKRKISELPVFVEPQVFLNAQKNIEKGYGQPHEDIIIRPLKGSTRVVRVSSYPLTDTMEPHRTYGYLFVGTDITQKLTTHGQLLEGHSYLVSNEKVNPAVDIFNGIQLKEYNGLVLTRGSQAFHQATYSLVPPLIQRYEKILTKGNDASQLQSVSRCIYEFISQESPSVVLIDRLDYLITRFSFHEVLKMLYQINIEIAKTQAILILRINPKLLSDQHYYLILEDFTLVPGQKIEPIELDEEIYEVLRFVKRQNESNMVVSYNKVGSHFHISKVTTKKRLDALQNQGLLSIQIKGRMKSVHITDKGRLLLERRLET